LRVPRIQLVVFSSCPLFKFHVQINCGLTSKSHLRNNRLENSQSADSQDFQGALAAGWDLKGPLTHVITLNTDQGLLYVVLLADRTIVLRKVAGKITGFTISPGKKESDYVKFFINLQFMLEVINQ